ncbi:MAG: hypothetical protein KAT05_14165 [Spirochaetes bacterium]|nr:hypothetical protein [Spirochaetota bacterium]
MKNTCKAKIFLLLSIFLLTMQFYGLEDPVDPDEPNVSGTNDEGENKFNIEYQKQSGIFNKGIIKDIKGFYLKLTWEGNETGSQLILIDFVKSIRVRGYKMVKKKKDNLGIVYYFPYIFDIELKEGKFIKNAEGKIKELESFLVYNTFGKEKCFTYFIRYWLEDKKIFNDNMSSDYNETPKVPDSVIIYLEFRDKK